MSFFNFDIPLISRKPSAFAVPASASVWRLHWQWRDRVLWSSFYTRHDQACLLWGLIALSIFAIAQFLPMSWTTQAVIASGLTAIGTIGMAWLTWRYSRIERLAWILLAWVILMSGGMVITNFSLWTHWGTILLFLSPLWLGLCGIGYLITGLGMQSRLILLCSAIHVLAIALLPYVETWRSLFTGLVIGGCVLVLAELQWDANGVCNYQATYDVD